MVKDTVALLTPHKVKVDAPDELVTNLVVAAKKKHPELWLSPHAQKSQRAKITLAYEQYVEALRECATKLNAKDEPTWAMIFVVRHKQNDRPGAQDALGIMFARRHRLIDLTDENAVVALEAGLHLKKEEGNAMSPAGASP
jgi:hypothetical protein